MATSCIARLAPVTARDGVDTRTKDNSGKAAAGTEETTRLGAGDQIRGGQTAALIEYLLPCGAEVEGSRMNAYWSNYLSTAERYIKGGDDSFLWTSYEHQQGCNERDIERESRKLGAGEEILNIHRQFYNGEVVTYKREMNDPNTPESCRELTREALARLLAAFKDELASQNKAATIIQRAFKAPEKCVSCDETRMGGYADVCAECYWEEDAAIKRERRSKASLLMRESAIDVDAVVQRAISPENVKGWDAYWDSRGCELRIRIPPYNVKVSDTGTWIADDE
jgi:hypothetical protein